MGKTGIRMTILAATMAVATPAAASELVLDPRSGHILSVSVNGYPLRLRVDPETPGYIILNREAAFRIVLTTPVVPARLIVGPTRLRGYSRPAPLSVGAGQTQGRVLWTQGRADDIADGRISPADLPYDRVVLRLSDPASDERVVELPMAFHRPFGLFHRVSIGDQPVNVRISTVRPESIATAAAGEVVGAEYDGHWTGDSIARMIKYGVSRPVRPMQLTMPMAFGGLALRSFVVRASDDRQQAQAEVAIDPDEMIVTGSGQRPNYDISLGRDWLAACSSLTWDNQRRRMLLSCRPDAFSASGILQIAEAR